MPSGIFPIIFTGKFPDQKKIKIFKQVGLDFLFDRILDFYMCKMMDEKRGFLDNIENVIADEPVVDILNSFLSGQCSKK